MPFGIYNSLLLGATATLGLLGLIALAKKGDMGKAWFYSGIFVSENIGNLRFQTPVPETCFGNLLWPDFLKDPLRECMLLQASRRIVSGKSLETSLKSQCLE